MKRRSRQTIAIQGEFGAFSYSAAQKLAGQSAQILSCDTFKSVFNAVESGKAQAAVVPIENTLHGSVHENYDHLIEYGLLISGETSLRICHNLITFGTTRFQDVRKAFSHPVALNQCRHFFAVNAQIEPVSYYDTAGSVKMLKEKRISNSAAIASATAAELYGGRVLRRNIEDNPQNYTRFFLLTKQPLRARKRGGWKTSVAFSTPNLPGALFKALACFALRDLSLTKIESRPLREKPWEYLFYVDLIGAQGDAAVESALGNLQEMTSFFKVLGSYQPTP